MLCGCGPATSGPAASPSTSVAPVIAPPTPTDNAVAAAPPARDCAHPTAQIESARPPSGWLKTGDILITMAGGAPVQIEVRDPSGAVVKVLPVKTDDRAAFRVLVRQEICLLGGVFGVPRADGPKKEPKDGVLPVEAIAPEVEDEHADLALLCKPRPTVSGVTPEEAFADLRGDLRWLTSTRLRALHQRDMDMFENEMGADEKHPVSMKARANELAAIAAEAGFAKCSYVDLLRALP